MNSRRSFFKRIAEAVAIVALAPQIAFGKRLIDGSVPSFWSTVQFWIITVRNTSCHNPEYLAAMRNIMESNVVTFTEFGDV